MTGSMGVATMVTVIVAASSQAQVASAPAGELRRVPQAWASTGVAYDNTDSLVACVLPDRRVAVLATSKEGNRVHVFDASTGKHLADFGRKGSGEGELRRPNGIAVAKFVREGEEDTLARSKRDQHAAGDEPAAVALVVERDNHRVQAFRIGSWKPIGIFGARELRRPYGLALSRQESGTYLYVTQVDASPDKTVLVFRLTCDADTLRGTFVRHLGNASGDGAILTPESILVDDELDRVLVCEEEKGRKGVRVYTREGRFTGTVFGDEVQGDPEGLVILPSGQAESAPGGQGVIILTDQQNEITLWRCYDRRSFRPMGVFTGSPHIAATDGICLYPAAFPNFPRGAFFAVHDDREIRAYDVARILAP